MPSQLSGENFIAVVHKSGLVEAERLKRLMAEHRTAGGANNADALAERLVTNNAITRWQADKLLLGKHSGYVLGKYRLLSFLGKGGMSSVYLAEHTLMRRRCAVKVLPSKRVKDTSYLKRFHREAEAVAKLDHPNIVRAYDIDMQMERDQEIHFLVMEYVDGTSLQEMVFRDGHQPFADAAEYIRQGAEGLAHAHQAGLVHRDIKPANLLVDTNGVVKILDLGLARFFDRQGEGDALTIQHDEKVLGTADYLAPEQALDSHTVDARADIYGLGCTLYFLLTGHPPFVEGTLAQRLMAHQQKEPPAIEQERPDIPPALAEVVRKMMAKKPEDRYSAAGEVASALDQWIAANTDEAWQKAHAEVSALTHGDSQALRGARPGGDGIAVLKPADRSSSTVRKIESGSTVVTPRPRDAGDSGVKFPVMQPVAKASKSTPALPAAEAPAPTEPLASAAAAKPAVHTKLVARPVAKPIDKPATAKPATGTPRPIAKPVAPNSPDVPVPESAATQTVAAPATPAGPDFSFLTAKMPPAEELPNFAGVETVNEFDPLSMQIPEAELDVAVSGDVTIAEFPGAASPLNTDATIVARSIDELDSALEEPATPTVADPTLVLPESASAPEDTQVTRAVFPVVQPVAPRSTAAASPLAPVASPPVAMPVVTSPRVTKPKPSKMPQASLAPEYRKLMLIGGTAVVGLAVLIGGAAALGLFSPKKSDTVAKSAGDGGASPSKKNSATTKPDQTAKSAADAFASWRNKREATVGPSGQFKTLGEALKTVKGAFQPKSRSDRFIVKLAPSTYEERVVIEQDFPENVTIQGTDGVVLDPSGGDPVIRVRDVKGLQITNLAVKANGKPVAIELADPLPRCHLHKLAVSGFSEAGIAIRGGMGISFEDSRLFLEDLRLEGSGSAVGIAVSRGIGSDAVDSSHLVFGRCRFLGPFAAGITVSGAEALNFEFRECVFAECETGVKLAEQTGWREFAFVQNTFYKCGYGVFVSEQPPSTQTGLSFRRNLFAETSNTEAFIEQGFDEEKLLSGQMLGSMFQNWTDQPKADASKLPKGELSIFSNGRSGEQNLAFASTNRDDAKFLAPTEASPQRRVYGQRPDEKEWIGAVAP